MLLTTSSSSWLRSLPCSLQNESIRDWVSGILGPASFSGTKATESGVRLPLSQVK